MGRSEREHDQQRRPRCKSERLPTTRGCGGALVNLISVAAQDLEDFEDWYTFEHFPERLRSRDSAVDVGTSRSRPSLDPACRVPLDLRDRRRRNADE